MPQVRLHAAPVECRPEDVRDGLQEAPLVRIEHAARAGHGRQQPARPRATRERHPAVGPVPRPPRAFGGARWLERTAGARPQREVAVAPFEGRTALEVEEVAEPVHGDVGERVVVVGPRQRGDLRQRGLVPPEAFDVAVLVTRCHPRAHSAAPPPSCASQRVQTGDTER